MASGGGGRHRLCRPVRALLRVRVGGARAAANCTLAQEYQPRRTAAPPYPHGVCRWSCPTRALGARRNQTQRTRRARVRRQGTAGGWSRRQRSGGGDDVHTPAPGGAMTAAGALGPAHRSAVLSLYRRLLRQAAAVQLSDPAYAVMRIRREFQVAARITDEVYATRYLQVRRPRVGAKAKSQAGCARVRAVRPRSRRGRPARPATHSAVRRRAS
mgnify:CR=1 FL=1